MICGLICFEAPGTPSRNSVFLAKDHFAFAFSFCDRLKVSNYDVQSNPSFHS
jgi:hypothetical protein